MSDGAGLARTQPRVYVVLLNWNGWRDTVGCLESLLKLDYDNFGVVICDNGSSDDSVKYLLMWSAGDLPVSQDGNPLKRTSSSQRFAPPRLQQLTRAQAESSPGLKIEDDWVLIQTGANLGFAGGCNVGLRHVLARGDADYVWLLNNDTVVEADALGRMVELANSSPRMGMIGSTLLFYDRPHTVQAFGGGTFSRWRAMTQHIGEGASIASVGIFAAEAQKKMTYVVGASMLVSRAFIETVGLMQEDYFLYFEELDWAERARRASPPFELGYASSSVVYHRVGASAGTGARSLSSIRHLSRSRLMFIQRFYPGLLLLARGRLTWESVKAALKGRFAEAAVLTRTALSAPGS
jgi:GT2 family glycosyltransferase